MDDEKLQQYIKDTVAHAKNSLFHENSNLVDMIFHKMEDRIEKAVDKATEKYTNGRLKALDSKIDDYIKEDLEWKVKALPVIESGTKVLNFGTVGVGLLKFITIFSVAFGFIWGFIKYILK